MKSKNYKKEAKEIFHNLKGWFALSDEDLITYIQKSLQIAHMDGVTKTLKDTIKEMK